MKASKESFFTSLKKNILEGSFAAKIHNAFPSGLTDF